MDCNFTELSYGETGFFSNIVSAYTTNDARLRPFYKHPPTEEGIASAISDRKKVTTDRALLVGELKAQYASLTVTQKLKDNIELLLHPDTFTVCTAHQPAIFTGNLFFIYKILHAIKLAEHLSSRFAGKHFVPVFYMGSEDADLDELGHIFLGGDKITWETKQKGAMGRMSTKGLESVLTRIEGELSVQPHGAEVLAIVRECYLQAPDIQTATLRLVNRLFGEYGLVVLIPDNPRLKELMIPVFEDELFNQRCSGVVEKTIAELSQDFKVQAHPRELNLFYLNGDIRERIERTGDEWKVVNTGLVFDKAGMQQELHTHPERFSPNVILRGVLQETILPNVAFIGGGGELAYWMELRGVFDMYNVPYPVLVLRNSFMIIEQKYKDKLDKLRIGLNDIFRDEHELLTELVMRESEKRLTLAEEITDATTYYEQLKTVASQVDITLTGHVAALQTRAIRPLQELEKKLLRAEKRKFEIEQRQLSMIKRALFPNGVLQERVENFLPFYARWGKEFISALYRHSFALEQKFGVLSVC